MPAFSLFPEEGVDTRQCAPDYVPAFSLFSEEGVNTRRCAPDYVPAFSLFPEEGVDTRRYANKRGGFRGGPTSMGGRKECQRGRSTPKGVDCDEEDNIWALYIYIYILIMLGWNL